ncbi:MAG: ABC transporter substrate-binding protein [Turicibacter sp.]|nr:ABC transporter substrate-binding protein [Turicibacter sp.]
MKKCMKSSVLAGTALVATLTLVGCGNGAGTNEPVEIGTSENFNKEGYPIVNEQITLTFAAPKASLAPNFGEMSIIQQLEEQSNIEIEWNNIPDADYSTKKNLMLASEDLPDAFWNSGFSDYDLIKYGSEGLIIPLNDLIEEYMPNLWAEMEKDPTIKSKLTAPDGNIYSLPTIEEMGLSRSPFFTSINTQWLENLGLEMPTTPEEFKEVLIAFRDQDANGNGNPNDEIPFSFMHMGWCMDIGDLMAAFGMPDNVQHRIVRDGEVIFTAVQDEYKEALQYFHELYKEGLIDPESFTQDTSQYLAKGQNPNDILGSFIWWETAEVVGPDRAENFTVMAPWKNKEGIQVTGHANGEDFGRAAFVVTKANENVAETLRFIDMCYEKYTSPQLNWGSEGDVFTRDENGVLVMNEAPEGTTMGEYRQKVAPGSGSPFIIRSEDFGTYVEMESRAQERLETIETLFDPYMEEEFYPNVFFSEEDLDTINFIEADIMSYVNTKRAQWITEGGIEAEWESYKKELEKMGLNDLMEIYQRGLDSYHVNAK